MKKLAKLDCGCRNDGHQWIEWCPLHRTEYQERHQRAQRDYEKLQFDPTPAYTPPAEDFSDLV